MHIIYIFFASFLIINSASATEWKLKKEDTGIEIYTRSAEGSSFDEFKGLMTLSNTSLADVLDVILDVSNYTNLFPDCISAEILKQDGKYYDIHYFAVKAPWPVKDRDAVYESITTVSDDGKHARVELKPLGDYVKEKKGFIRLHKGTGYWELEEISSNTVLVTYQFRGDPGGKIPAWLANSTVVSNPFQTLTNLRSLLKK